MNTTKSLHVTALFLLVALLLCASCARKQQAGPGECFHAFQIALSDKDFAAAWDMLSGASQKKFEHTMFDETKKEITSETDAQKKEPHPVLGKTGNDILKMSPKDFFILLMGETEAGKELASKASTSVEGVRIEGDKAHLKVKDQKEEVTLLKEKGTWKVDL
jgi:hypothetical protein